MIFQVVQANYSAFTRVLQTGFVKKVQVAL